MIENDFYISQLIAHFLSRDISPEDEERINAWRQEKIENEILFQKIIQRQRLNDYLKEIETVDKNEGWENIQKRIRKNKTISFWRKYLSYAAMIIIPLLLIGITIYKHEQNSIKEESMAVITETIKPGSSQAILTLDNGKKMLIDSNNKSELKKVSNTYIKIDSASINYQKTSGLNTKTAYNKIETPHGSEYSLLLSDGTKIYINAMSSLRFPVKFDNNTREVELTGEAFFEVAKNGTPFIVKTGNTKIEVLGTTFNLSAYPKEECTTTLVNGSVKVIYKEGNSCVLKPSQQCTINQDGMISIKTVDTTFYTAWKDGKISFKDQRLEDIMNILSRWYDMNVIYTDNEIKNIRFGCNVNRYEDITKFVKLLEETNKIKAEIKGNTITLYIN